MQKEKIYSNKALYYHGDFVIWSSTQTLDSKMYNVLYLNSQNLCIRHV